MNYIILDENKRPIHSFKNGIGAKTWDEVKDCPSVGLIVPKPYIVLDFDNEEEAEIMMRIIRREDLKCRVMRTTRGIHVWFKSEEPWKCFTRTRLACGLHCDCRSHSKNSYVKIIDDGKPRRWIIDLPLEKVQEVPKWLYPIQSGSRFQFLGMGEGDGRNQELFSYIVYLQSKGYEKEEIKECLQIVNDYIFAESLDAEEFESICRDDAFKPREEINLNLNVDTKDEKYDHSEYGKALMQHYHIKTLHGQMFIYRDGYYQLDTGDVENKLIDMKENITSRQRIEALKFIMLRTKVGNEVVNTNPYIVNLKNTRLDVRTGELLDFTPEEFETNRLPVNYTPNAYSEDLEKMLRKVFCNDEKVIELFEEMVGYCLIRHCRYHKAFMLYGSGSNGKSTILGLLKAFLGDNNHSAIELNRLSERFMTSQVENKLANIGDDINSTVMRDTGTLKKLFSGDSLQVERKNQDPYTITPYATMIFSCNEIPKSRDKSDGLYRRWVFIPFNAKISPNDEDYDPMIYDKITTEEAMSHLLNLAIRGARRLIQREKFTEPEKVINMLDRYRKENSAILSWIEDQSLDEAYFLKNPRDYIYEDFREWCIQSGVKNINGKINFFKEISKEYKFCELPMQKQVDGVRKRYFQVDIMQIA